MTGPAPRMPTPRGSGEPDGVAFEWLDKISYLFVNGISEFQRGFVGYVILLTHKLRRLLSMGKQKLKMTRRSFCCVTAITNRAITDP